MRNGALIISLIWMLQTACSVSEQSFTVGQKYAPETLKKDLSVMEKVLRKNHPSLFWYATPAEIDSAFRLAHQSVSDSMTQDQFRVVLSKVVDPIRCGHTSIRFSRAYSRALVNNRKQTFPLNIKITDDSSFILLANLHRKDSVLRRGMVLTAINGMSSQSIVDSLRVLVQMDGYSKNFSLQNLSNNFPFYYNIRFGLKDRYTIDYIDEAGSRLQTTIPVYDYAADTVKIKTLILATPKQIRKNRKSSVRKLNIDSSGTFAILTINDFSHKLKARFFHQTFSELRKRNVQHLILDIRNNGGGLIQRSLLLSRYIHQKPFRFIDSITAPRRSVTSIAYIQKGLIYKTAMFFMSKREQKGQYSFRAFQSRIKQPKKNYFKGQSYILTGGFTFSAATLFAAGLKGLDHVTIVGEETGGGYYGNNGVFIPDIILPHTQMRVRLPLYRIVNNKNFPKDGRGVLPDVEVKADVHSIRKNQDPKLDKALEIIRMRLR